MRKRLLALAGLVLAAIPSVGHAEMGFKALSVTATSQTYVLPKPSALVTLCSVGANDAHFRAFWHLETTAAATTANAPLVAGTATAPVCFTIPKTETAPNYIAAISIVCDTAETATVWLFYQ